MTPDSRRRLAELSEAAARRFDTFEVKAALLFNGPLWTEGERAEVDAMSDGAQPSPDRAIRPEPPELPRAATRRRRPAAEPAPGATMLSPAALAERWGCSRDAIYKRIAAGQLPAQRIGGMVRIPLEAIKALETEPCRVAPEDTGSSSASRPASGTPAGLKDRRKIARSTGTRDQAEAQTWLERFRAALDAPEQPERPTVASALDGYLAGRLGAVVDHERLVHCARHLKRRMGWLTLDELLPSHSRTYATARAQDGAGPGTIGRELRALRTALAWAKGEKLVAQLPDVPIPVPPAPRERWLTREDAATLIAAAVTPHIRLFIELALGTAARSGALKELTWDQVDLAAGVIDFGRGTGNKRKTVIPINPALVAVLAEAKTAAQSRYVIEYHGRRCASIGRGFSAAVKRSGIAHCTPHDLRRTAGSWMLQAGLSIELVSGMLGLSIQTARNVYTHWKAEWLRQAAAVLGAPEVATQLTRKASESA